jgi:ketosteroid isomerase-like protein
VRHVEARPAFLWAVVLVWVLGSIGPSIVAGAQAAATTVAKSSSKSDLVHAIEAYDRATIQSDVKTLERLTAEDYLLVNSDMSVQSKTSYLADFAKPGFHIDGYAMTEPFRMVRADSALVGGALRLNWTQEGRRHSRRARVVHFWVRHDRRWRLAYTQLTRAAD